jgi:hypothetical protein
VAGVLCAGVGRRAQVAAALFVYLGAINLATGIWPAHRGDGTRQRAEAAAADLADGDLVIFPGHSWDEYVGFFARARVHPMPLVYYAGRDGADEAWLRFEREVAAAMMRGGRVYALRIFSDDGDVRGWSELERLGLSRERVRARLLDGRRAVDQGQGGPVRLDPIL